MLSLSCLKFQVQRSLLFSQTSLLARHQLRLMSTFQQGTLSPPKEEDLKFSSFLRKEKTYTIPAAAASKVKAERFVAKPEVTQIGFDPNIRHRVMKMPNHLLYRYMYGIVPKKGPESAYVAVHNKGETWHLFNAAKMPLGRMAEMISIFIRGKHKPTYTMNRFDLGDKVVVVNASIPHTIVLCCFERKSDG
jgi:Ribosomal protein L13